MINLEDRKIEIGDYVFQRHEGQLNVAPCNDFLLDYDGTFAWDSEPCLSYYPVDFFSDLIDALNYYKDKGLQVKLTGEELKQLMEGNGLSDWASFNRYDFIKDYGAFRRLVLTSVKNGATLCKDCHKKYHKKYGWNGKQKTFSKFIKEMLD